jgi:mono/diheme cytochrome c family protein
MVRVWAMAMAVVAGCGGGGEGGAGTEGSGGPTSGGEQGSGEFDAGTTVVAPEADAGAATSDVDAGTTVAPIDADAGTPIAATADAGTAAAVDPATAWRERIQRGRRAFSQRCDSCHPGGDEDIGPRIIGKGLSPERMRTQIRRGSGRMRPISEARLSIDSMEDLLAYLTTIRTVRGLGPDTAPSAPAPQ